MPLDAINYHFLVKELAEVLQGGRIDKVIMPRADVLMFLVRSSGKNYNLIISSEAAPRCYITQSKLTSSDTPLSFCLHLRRHILGGIIQKVSGIEFERIIRFHITARDELGEVKNRVLITEVMGKYSNVVLTDESFRITGALKNIPLSESRPIMPGIDYAPPADSNRLFPTSSEADSLAITHDEHALTRRLIGVSPVTIREINRISQNHNISFSKATQKMLDSQCCPVVYYVNGRAADFSFCDYESVEGDRVRFHTMSEAMDAYFLPLESARQEAQLSGLLKRVITAAADRHRKRLAQHLKEQEAASDFEKERILGELITANLFKVRSGDQSLVALNWYSGENEVIKLTEKTPQQDAAKHFKRYQKKKRALQFLEKQIEEARDAQEYFEGLETMLKNAADLDELGDLYDELEAAGLIKEQQKKTRKVSSPRKFMSDGFEILIGKNNLQNEALVKQARGEDYWLHAQGIHGSHVIIRSGGKDVSRECLICAAELAAFFSKARASENVPVDYTKAKNVHKKRGAAPGKVDYFGAKTLFVKPRLIEID